MFIALKTKIWLTIITIVLLFTFFTLYYFPAQQRQFFLKNYNDEVQHLANTVALGVKIALNEQNYEGVKTAMEFVRENPALMFVSLLQTDTVFDKERNSFQIQETIFNTYPENVDPKINMLSNDSVIIKRAPFQTSLMSGAVLLGFSTQEINQNQRNIRHTSLIVSSIIFLVGILIGLWLSRNFSVPVVALRDAAIRVGKGDLTPVVKRYSHDEIGELAIAFNKMVQDLYKAREELNHTNSTLSKTNEALSTTLNDLKATQTQLIQSEKMASLGELTAGIAHEIQNPLNFVNNFSEINVELIDEIENAIRLGHHHEVLAIAAHIKENNFKIAHHGKRADVIVRGMLLHSRNATGEKQLTDINALVDEYLRLSYYGLRAKDSSFNAVIQTQLDVNLTKIEAVSQDIGRVLLNLFNNAFYSMQQKNTQLNGTYQPIINVSTKQVGDRVEIRVKDNGNGIPQRIVDKIYQPFFTTKPTGEGTGLGLSLSYDIITKGHGGEIKVESKEGEYAEFVVQLPA